jgi:hypothetical protein
MLDSHRTGTAGQPQGMYRTVGCGYWVVPLHLTLILRSAIFTLVLSSGMGMGGGGEWEEDVEDDVVGNGMRRVRGRGLRLRA